MADEADPKGMERPVIPTNTNKPRPRISFRANYGPHSQDDPKTSRPIIPIQAKNKPRPIIRMNPVAGEGNDPKGMERPRLQLHTRTPGVADDRDMYDEPDDGLDVPDFVQPKDRPF